MERFQKQHTARDPLVSVNDVRLWLGAFLFISGGFIFGYLLEQGITVAPVPVLASAASIATVSLGIVLFFRSEW